LALAAPALAQAGDTPFVPDEWRFGRRQDEQNLSFCIDKRDPDWPVAEKIGDAIAGALLLRPRPVIVDGRTQIEDIENLYRILLESCDVYFGFKLLPQAIPPWMVLTRPYYRASYVLLAKDTGWPSLAEMPPARAIGSVLGTSADLRLVQMLQGRSAAAAWPRFPMSNDEAVLTALDAGRIGAALVWAPAYWSLAEARPAWRGFRRIAPAPLTFSDVGIGAALLARQTFLRTAVDQAIEALAKDGTIRAILEKAAFPAESGG
jgi:polar amino acid transport system substrate-binding protein